jgi:phospholipid/cholesterol/gamma-HCH transport system substrate-binding protein
MGGKAIQLIYAPIVTTQAMHAPNDTLLTQSGDGLMAQLSGSLLPKIQTIATQADSLIYSVRVLVENKDIKKSLSSIERTTADLAITSSSLKKLMNNDLPHIVNNVNDITTDFKVVSGNLKKIDVAATFASIDNTINNLNLVSKKMNSSDGTIGLLLNNKDLYINLTNTASSADKLLIDLKSNPKRYVHFSLFGSKAN